jgi:cytochrome c-type protein NapB
MFKIPKMKILLIGTLLTTIGIVGCQTGGGYGYGSGGPIDEASVGIGADGVFNDPSPSTFEFPTTKTGESDRIKKSYHTAPPMVAHTFVEYLPITMENNECMECHDKPKLIDREYIKGKKLAMSDDHYGGFGGRGDKDEVSGSHYTCTTCHAPASDAQPLVENTF